MVTGPPDDVVDTGPFELVGELGRGGMGVVYEVRDERGTRLALKSVHDVAPREILRIKTEFRALRDIQHPNLVRIGELFERDGRWSFTMELVDGVDFLCWVRQDGGTPDPSIADTLTRSVATAIEPAARRGPPLDATGATSVERLGAAVVDEPPPPPPPGERAAPAFDESRLRAALRGVLEGLTALHRHGLVHRDIKPSNIKVTADGRVVILDFGVVAELVRPPAPEVVGTWAYMAPEQADGVASPASDWYAVGVMLFRALTGHLPFGRGRRGRMHVRSPDEYVAGAPADLVKLCVELLEAEPAARAGESDVRAVVGGVLPLAATSVHAPPFVGRSAELAHLHELAGRPPGTARAVIVTGASGMGKTAVVRRFLRERASGGVRTIVLEGRCDPREVVPYNALDGVVDDLARFLVTGGAAADTARSVLAGGELARLFPVFDAPTGRAAGRAGEDGRAAAVRELASAMAALCRVAPVTVFIDDLHWADADSRALLAELLGEGAPPVLVVATSRLPAAEVAATWRIPVEELGLDGLDHDDARRLVGLIGGHRVDVDAVLRDTGGHPMFIAEVARYFVTHGGRPVGPGGLDEALCARSLELDRPARELLDAIVVAGVVSREDLSAMAELPGDAFDEVIGRLRHIRLVRVGGADEGDLAPYHDRVREALYSRIARPRREMLHGRLAAALLARDAPPELLAHHLARAGERDGAAHHAARAAERAGAALAFERAAEWYAMALDVGALPDDRRRALLVARGDMLDRAGRPRDAGDAFLAAGAVGELDPVERLELRRRAAEQFLAGGYLHEGMEVARDLLAALDLHVPTGRRAVTQLLWRDLAFSLRRLRWRSRSASEVPPRDLVRADTCWSAATRLSLVDTLQSAVYAIRTPVLCLATGEPTRIARALALTAMAAAIIGRRGRLERLAAATARAVAEASVPEGRCYDTLVATARAMFLDQDWPATHRLAAQALGEWRGAGRGLSWEADLCEQYIAWSLLAMGELRALRDHVRRVTLAARRAGNRFLEVTFRVQFPGVFLLGDEVAEASADLEEAFGSWRVPETIDALGNQFFWTVKSRTLIATYRGELDRDAAALDEQWQTAWRSVLTRLPPVRLEAALWEGDWRVARAVEARERGAPAEMKAQLARAAKLARVLRRLSLPAAQDLALRLDVARAAAAGDLEQARQRLPGLIERLEARHMRSMAAAARARLATLVGGDDGAALAARADEHWRAQAAVRPDRIVAALLPGWPHPG